MVAPLGAMLGQIAAGAAVSNAVSSGSSGILDPLARSVSVPMNVALGGQWPGYDQLIDAYYRGYIDQRQWISGLAALGIETGTSTTAKLRELWQAIHNIGQNRISIDQALVQYHRGAMTPAELRTVFHRHKIWYPPDIEAIKEPRNPPPLTFVLDLLNRNAIGENDAMAMLRALGYGFSTDRIHMLNLRFGIPGPSDLIRFSVREVWDDNVVRRFGYDREFPEAFRYWMQRQGLSYTPSDVFGDVPQGTDIPWPQAYWRAHWEVLSPHQAYEAYFRLRPNRLWQFRHINRDIRPFTLEDLKTVLKIHDYPEPVRDWLAAIAHRPLTRVDIRRMRKLGVLTREGVYEAYLDLGYSPADAQNQTAFVEVDIANTRQAKETARIKTAIIAAYESGVIGREEAATQLYRILYATPAELADSTEAGIASIANRAQFSNEIAALLDSIDLKLANQLARDSIRTIRKAYLDGLLDESNAKAALVSIPIQPNRIELYLQMWNMQRQRKSRQATAAMITGWFRDGLIGRKEAFYRLINLGYSEKDANLILEKASAPTSRSRRSGPPTIANQPQTVGQPQQPATP